MGMDADLLAIGPVKVLKRWDALSYPDDFYDDVPEETVVIGIAAVAWTTDMSRNLAKLCGVEPWDLGNHLIKQVPSRSLEMDYWMDELIGTECAWDVLERIKGLLIDGAELWYRPNG